ncbi:MAG: M90 family metallopeptidase [Cytophagaceae bacterium]
MQLIAILIFLVGFSSLLYYLYKPKQPLTQPDELVEEELLSKYVVFYQQLSIIEKKEFLQRVRYFLSHVRIVGVNTTVEDIDKVFIAAGAIIPIFAFKNWTYKNIHEVLVYPNSFSRDYRTEGKDRFILGQIGEGAMQNMMILSQQALRAGFLYPKDQSNTAIHEFVHLVDKSDGYTDGDPETLIPHQYSIPWLKRIHEEIQLVQSGDSDINPYATTNQAEFLAVASEYFFEQPDKMEAKHPELYKALTKIFQTEV